MRILFVVPWDQEFGGVASVVGNLAVALREKKHEVLFLHPGSRNVLWKENTKWGFEGYKLRMRGPSVEGHPVRSFIAFLAFFPFTLIQLIRFLLTKNVEIVNVHYPIPEFFYLSICSKLLRIKLVTSVHGSDFFPGGKPLEQYPAGTRYLLSSSDRIVAPSNGYLVAFLNLFPDQKIKGCYIHNGVNFTELDNIIQEDTNVVDAKYLLCIAAHNRSKGIDVLLRAYSALSPHYAHLQLVLVGDGPLRKDHEELARYLGLQDMVRFQGNQVREDVARLIKGCEVFILPSRAESFGIVIAEAMAFRKPVVATAVGGIPEIIEDGKSGLLVDPDNPESLCQAVCSVLDDENLRKSLADNGYARVRMNFTCEQVAEKYEALFAELLDYA